MSKLKKIPLRHARKAKDAAFDFISYQEFGQPLHTAPVVVVLHALTGNSEVAGSKGWWNGFIGEQKGIDTSKFTVLAFNIPGNGFDDQLMDNPYAYRLKNVAAWVLEALDALELQEVYALVGGSLGGCLAWQIVALRPDFAKHLIPVAAHWKASPWVVAQGMIQDRILSNSKEPIADARAHAMTFYRNPNAFAVKFNQEDSLEAAASVYDWLNYHGKTLENRFALAAYKFMNWLLTTHDITAGGTSLEQTLKAFTGTLHLVGIHEDLLYAQRDIKQTFWVARELGTPVHHYTLISDQGHDAFLIEQTQLSGLLASVFASASLKENSYELS